MSDGVYVINLDKYRSIGIHWIAVCPNGGNVAYFHSFGVENIPKKISTFVGKKKCHNKYLYNTRI